MPTLSLPPGQKEKPVCTAPGEFKLPNGPLEVWQIDFIQLPLFHGYKYGLVIICMFSHWPEALLVDKLMSLQWLKLCWRRLFLFGELRLNSTVIQDHIFLVKCYNKSMLYGQLYIIFAVLTILNLQV